MNSTQPFARSCAFLLMCFLCIAHLLMTLSFLIDRKLFAPVLPLSLLLAVVVSYFYSVKNGMPRQNWYKVWGVSLLVGLFSVIFAFFLALNMAVPLFGLSCNLVNDWTTSVVHDRKFCTAYFETGAGHASFGGSKAHPKDLTTFRYDFLNEADDCQLQVS